MKSKKGQALFLVIILLPIIILAMGFMIEVSLITYANTKLNSLTKTIIKSEYDSKDEEKIRAFYEKNDIKLQELEIDTENGLEVTVAYNIDSFLGGLINKDTYRVKTSIKGIKDGNKIIYKKG